MKDGAMAYHDEKSVEVPEKQPVVDEPSAEDKVMIRKILFKLDVRYAFVSFPQISILLTEYF